MLTEAIEDLVRVCQARGLSLSLDYHEADNMWDASTSGPTGNADFYEVKNDYSLIYVVQRLAAKLRA